MLADVSEFRKAFSKAKHIAVLTGAGVSAESGVPTFRGAGGYWRKWQAQVNDAYPPGTVSTLAPAHFCFSTVVHIFLTWSTSSENIRFPTMFKCRDTTADH